MITTSPVTFWAQASVVGKEVGPDDLPAFEHFGLRDHGEPASPAAGDDEVGRGFDRRRPAGRGVGQAQGVAAARVGPRARDPLKAPPPVGLDLQAGSQPAARREK